MDPFTLNRLGHIRQQEILERAALERSLESGHRWKRVKNIALATWQRVSSPVRFAARPVKRVHNEPAAACDEEPCVLVSS